MIFLMRSMADFTSFELPNCNKYNNFTFLKRFWLMHFPPNSLKNVFKWTVLTKFYNVRKMDD